MRRVTLLYLKILIYLIFIDAALFKTAFEEGQKSNASLAKPTDEVKKEEQEEKPEQVIHTEAAKDDEKAEKEEVKEEEEEGKTG